MKKTMKKTTTYHRSELKQGKCKYCSEISNEILIGDGRCVDCIQEEEFIDSCYVLHSEPDFENVDDFQTDYESYERYDDDSD